MDFSQAAVFEPSPDRLGSAPATMATKPDPARHGTASPKPPNPKTGLSAAFPSREKHAAGRIDADFQRIGSCV